MTTEADPELDMALSRAGITLPPGRYAGVLATHRDLQKMMPILRQPRTAAAEPAGVYVLDTITREQAP
ncbi:MAG: hypothetical protein E7K72_05525 [Roseomonas mucosa]|uniref:Uncharacterized protein n=1 Tax=Roseomonas mucosa TaxID=207340 RepID=A0A1S8D954_9PROT|nr:hypothetical protein [Roseomonas mucosa]MDT8276470.1 hypothetical protein [Roseomonas mucosa]MDT8352751.1 hypothetical protein [Roseomonas mucosa]MDU7520850.1 hypothetical protein [Roseomonas mucosa]ONH84902.1 hypothetical protein APZ41_001540 [Roseomonas mucosa]